MSFSRRHLLKAAGFGAALPALAAMAGCGWKPLYARNGENDVRGTGVESHLAGIGIDPVRWNRNPSPLQDGAEAIYDSRIAQIMHNALRDQLTPLGPPAEPVYELAVELAETIDSVIATDSTKTRRERVKLVARYTLSDRKGNSVLKDQARAITSYDVFQDPYSDLSGRNDARQRLARQLAEAIKTRLAAFFTTRG